MRILLITVSEDREGDGNETVFLEREGEVEWATRGQQLPAKTITRGEVEG